MSPRRPPRLFIAGGALVIALSAVLLWRPWTYQPPQRYADDSSKLVSDDLLGLIAVPNEAVWPTASRVGTGTDNELVAEPCRESTGPQTRARHVAGVYAGPKDPVPKAGLDIELFDFGTTGVATEELESIDGYFVAGCRPNLLYQDMPSEYWLRFTSGSDGVYSFTIERDRPVQEAFQQVRQVGRLLLDAICWGPQSEWGRCRQYIDRTILNV